ncbi:MAG: ATP-binding protein [Bacteroidales bacterium]|nr:ATP-binding protein [Bacteroidales bacterium]
MRNYKTIGWKLSASVVAIFLLFMAVFLFMPEAFKEDRHIVWISLAMIVVLIVVLSIFISIINRIIAEQSNEENSRIRRELTQNISHELKTPVTSIQGYLETIISNPDMEASTKEQFLKRCYAQAVRLGSLLQDISILNRLDYGAKMHEYETVDIAALIDTIIKETALQRGVASMAFHNRLPEKVLVEGNYSLLYSIFRNLADNSINYAGEGATITVSATETSNAWKFVFSDDGVGIPPEHLKRIFERFYRVDKGRSRKMGGTGLGLSIVKNAVLFHGGTIAVASEPNAGVRYSFTIPKKARRPKRRVS